MTVLLYDTVGNKNRFTHINQITKSVIYTMSGEKKTLIYLYDMFSVVSTWSSDEVVRMEVINEAKSLQSRM